MVRIALINPPFAIASFPSIALTQLRSVLVAHFDDRIEVKVLYVNLDFVSFLGLEPYEILSRSIEAQFKGMGDWFFREAAYPKLADNSKAYLTRYFSGGRNLPESLNHCILKKRPAIPSFLDELIGRYELEKYSLVGFTSTFSQNMSSFAMARKLKERNPDIITVIGGGNCEPPMGQVLARNVEHIDYVFAGPALNTFPRFVGHLVDGEEQRCHDIRGVLSRSKLASASREAGHEFGEELDINAEVPLDYDDFFAVLDEKNLSGVVNPVVLFETSRGCWWGERSRCTFCGIGGDIKHRSLKPDKALKQFEQLFDRYASRTSEFKSIDPVMPKEYPDEVFSRLKPPKNVSIFYEVRPNIKEREVECLANAGVRKLQPGIESISNSSLKLMRKGTTSFQNIKFLKYCLANNMEVQWNLLMCIPGEEEEVYAKYFDDLPALTHLYPPTGIYPIRFDRYSPYQMHAEDYGLKLQPCDFYKMNYPFPKQDLADMAYFFVDGSPDAKYIIHMAKWIGKLRQQVEDWRAQWFQQDSQSRPQLSFLRRGDSRVIYDSRSGTAVEHRIDDATLQVLDLLSSQRKLAHLARTLSDTPEAELERRIRSLEERKLIFRDGELIMSLVVESA